MKAGLILHRAGLGDLIMFSPIIKFLKEKFPKITLYFFTSDFGSYQLLKLYEAEGAIQKVIYANYVHKKIDLLKLLGFYFAHRIDLILTTTAFNSFKGELLYLLFFKTKTKVLYTLQQKPIILKNFITYNYFGKHQVEQNADLLNLTLGVTLKKEQLNLYLPKILTEQRGDEGNEDKILIHPGSSKGGTIRRYPLEKFINVADKLKERGYNVSFILGPAEKEYVYIIEKTEHSVFYVENLIECAKVIKSHKYFLNSDSGLGHLAAGLGNHVFTIFGPANPNLTKPYSPKTTIIQSMDNLPCRPCIHPLGKRGCNNPLCLTLISEDLIVDIIDTTVKSLKFY